MPNAPLLGASWARLWALRGLCVRWVTRPCSEAEHPAQFRGIGHEMGRGSLHQFALICVAPQHADTAEAMVLRPEYVFLAIADHDRVDGR